MRAAAEMQFVATPLTGSVLIATLLGCTPSSSSTFSPLLSAHQTQRRHRLLHPAVQPAALEKSSALTAENQPIHALARRSHVAWATPPWPNYLADATSAVKQRIEVGQIIAHVNCGWFHKSCAVKLKHPTFLGSTDLIKKAFELTTDQFFRSALTSFFSGSGHFAIDCASVPRARERPHLAQL